MSGNVISLFARPQRVRGWSDQELAEFYRVRDVLAKSGISLATESGLSDEGEPWFIFFRGNSDEVFVHFARIDGLYVIAIPALGDRVLRGLDFRSLIDAFLSGETDVVVIPQGSEKVRRLFIHPNALMVAFVATVLLLSDGIKGSAAAMDSIADSASAPSASSRIPFFDWAHYHNLVDRAKGTEFERTITMVAAVVVASIAANEFNLFDKVNALLSDGRYSIFAAASDSILSDQNVSERVAAVAHAEQADRAPESSLFAYAGGASETPAKVLDATESATLTSVEANIATELDLPDVTVEHPTWDRDPGIVSQVLPLLAGAAQTSPETIHSIHELALTLIGDLFDRDDFAMTFASEQLLSALNRVIHAANFLNSDPHASASGFMLDQGALVIEIPEPASEVTTTAISHDIQPGSLEAAGAPEEPAAPVIASNAPETSTSMSVIEIDSMASIFSELRAFLSVAEGVDLVVDHDTMVFVDQSDMADGAALTIGAAWKMPNDLTIMVVGSVDTIHAYHESIASIA